MIFQTLIQYYDRLAHDDRVPPFGFSREDLGFSITLNRGGDLVGVPRDLRNKLGANRYEYFSSIVPYTNEVNVRSSGAANTPNFMVDKATYIFGMSGTATKEKYRVSFKDMIDKICGDSDDPGVIAVRAFIKKWNPKNSSSLPFWNEICGPNGKWVAFELEGERGFIHERPAVQELWKNYLQKSKYRQGVSFIDGTTGNLQGQYAQFKFGSGASLVSFNENAYESYKKKRGENAPIHVLEEFKSSAALKFLFNSKSQRLQICDTTTVFWTERESPIEVFMGQLLNPQHDAPDNMPLRLFLDAARRGEQPQLPDYDGDVKFYILGVALNKARLALRFWHMCSLDELKERIGRHFRDLAIERGRHNDLEYPGIWHLLKETARETKDISPLLGGALMRSILTGAAYPLNLYNGVLNRVRADQAKKHPTTGRPVPNVNYLRASILKAVLKRNHNMEVPMSLDKEKHDIAYLLGRLFAVLEKAQLDALGKVNATIKDRFFGSASATPASVFPRLLSLSQHHIEKAEYGYVSDRRIAEIMEHIDEFPAHLDLKQQGIFAIAYYHQKNDLYKKQPKKEGEGNE